MGCFTFRARGRDPAVKTAAGENAWAFAKNVDTKRMLLANRNSSSGGTNGTRNGGGGGFQIIWPEEAVASNRSEEDEVEKKERRAERRRRRKERDGKRRTQEAQATKNQETEEDFEKVSVVVQLEQRQKIEKWMDECARLGVEGYT